jgi:hypothetical protein
MVGTGVEVTVLVGAGVDVWVGTWVDVDVVVAVGAGVPFTCVLPVNVTPWVLRTQMLLK